MKIGDLLEAVMQSGISPSSNDRMRNSLGGGGVLESLAGMFGGASSGGADDSISSPEGGGMLGGVLGNILGEAGRAVGGNQNLALGGLGALAGALLGGKKSLGGALGGGAMALLGAMAFQALKGRGGQKPRVPLGLQEPKTDAERAELERHSELVLKAMINAAKADGQIDEGEINRILGKLRETGADKQAQKYLMTEMQKPMETENLIAAAQGQQELAAEMYGASLLAIEVDTAAEINYLNNLAAGLGLHPEVTQSIHEAVGLKPA
jgi:uncharacterized membrane protein YebE (DUF533 family)